MAASKSDPKSTTVAVAPALSPGEEAAAEAFGQLDFGEAPFVGLIGDTGTGKTYAAEYFVDLFLKKSPGSVFIADDKEMRARFKGQERIDVEDLRKHPVDPALPRSRVIVFRGVPSKAQKVDLETVAELAWRRVGHGRKTLIVADELISGRRNLTISSQWRSGVEWVPKTFTEGRSPGVGCIWGAQSPQLVPIDPFEQSNAIVCFRLAGLGLARLKERDYLLGGAGEVIPKLHGPPQPPAERGDFVLLRRGQPWNGKIYKFRRAA